MVPYPREGRKKLGLVPQAATPRLIAAWPVIATPLGVMALVGTPVTGSKVVPQSGELAPLRPGVIGWPAAYGVMGVGSSWLRLLSRVRCVPLLPTYERVATVLRATSCWISKCHC